MSKKKRWEYTYNHNRRDDLDIRTIRDGKTGVKYLIVQVYASGGWPGGVAITPLLNKHGNVVIDKID